MEKDVSQSTLNLDDDSTTAEEALDALIVEIENWVQSQEDA